MSAFNPNALANATAPTGNYEDSEPPAVGTYEVVVDNAEAFTAGEKGDFVKFELRVATGDQAGHAWTELFGFKTTKAYDFFKGVCERLEVDLSNVVGVPSLDEAVKVTVGNWYVVDVVASRNPSFPKNSVFFKDGGAISAGQSPAAPEPAAVGGGQQANGGGVEDPDIPFAFDPLPEWVTLKGTSRAD